MLTDFSTHRLYSWEELEDICRDLAIQLAPNFITTLKPLKQEDFIVCSLLAHFSKCTIDLNDGATFSITSNLSPAICFFDIVHPHSQFRPISYERIELDDNGVFPKFSFPWNKI